MVKAQRRARRRLRRFLWHGAQGVRLAPAFQRTIHKRISTAQLSACGFFRECPNEESDCSIFQLISLIPTSARLSRGARRLLPLVLAWLAGHRRLPLGVAGVFFG